VSIDADIRVGTWCSVAPGRGGLARVARVPGMVAAAEPRILAWDIETTKAPLMFPNAAHDQIYMVSYMLDGAGFLLINREIVSEDVPDFEYSPTKEFAGPFVTRNLPDERAVIAAELRRMADESGCCLVVTTGGTGPAPRDVTTEATLDVIEKELPGFGELMRATSLRYVPTAILSRQTAGIRGRTLIVNLPGRPKAIRENLEAVFPAIPYCLDLIGGPRLETNESAMKAFRPKS
jgi:molybdopterin adenylyltransferase